LGDDSAEDTEAELFKLFAERDQILRNSVPKEKAHREKKEVVHVVVDPLRHHRKHEHLNGAFGSDKFGQKAEKFARFFGTPKFIIIQTVIVMLWIMLNIVGIVHHWDPYPFLSC
jgi:uncharacterized membrane protein